MPLLSIIIPVYNNENCLHPLVDGIKKVLDTKIDYELILVNDGSADKSWEIIQSIYSKEINRNLIKAINLQQNYGQENAKMAGLRITKGDFVLFMDADCQHNPVYIFDLISKCKEGYDVCYANFNNSPFNITKRLGSWLYNYLATKLFEKPKNIYLSSYNVFTKDIADKVVKHLSPIINIDAIILQYTKNITQIFVEQSESLNTKSNYTPLKLISLFFKLLPGFSLLPLRIILFLGIFQTSICGLFILMKLFFHSYHPELFSFITLSELIVITSIGFVLIAIGIIGEYMGKIYFILHTAKQYEIESVLTSEKND